MSRGGPYLSNGGVIRAGDHEVHDALGDVVLVRTDDVRILLQEVREERHGLPKKRRWRGVRRGKNEGE